MSWKTYKYTPVDVTDINDKLLFRVWFKKRDYSSTYRNTVCRLFTKLGDVLCAGSIRKTDLPRNGRRKSWLGDKIWANYKPGFILHQKLQHLILYGNFKRGTSLWKSQGDKKIAC